VTWFLMTAGRPSYEKVVEACYEYGTSLDLQVIIDHDRAGIGPLMQECFRANPHAGFYGWLADDTYPATPGWNLALERAAGDWQLSYAADGGYINPADLHAGTYFSSGLCWGGELVRTVGWWALPGLKAAWIDIAWADIVSPLGLHRYLPDVLVDHRHPLMGKRDHDEFDAGSQATIEQTRGLYDAWLLNERPQVVRRVARTLPS
jgi:hypothetical protein